MRIFAPAILAIQVCLAMPARADNASDSSLSITDLLPLFVRNHCEEIKAPADQLFCGDPALNAAGDKLGSAIAERLSRLPNRRLAIEENARFEGSSRRKDNVVDVPLIVRVKLSQLDDKSAP